MSYIDKTTRSIEFQSFEGTRNAFVVSVGLNQWRLFRCSKNSPAYHFIFIILGYKKLLVLVTYLNMKMSKYNTYIIELNPYNVACISSSRLLETTTVRSRPKGSRNMDRGSGLPL